jgi:hypothetical protein
VLGPIRSQFPDTTFHVIGSGLRSANSCAGRTAGANLTI